jgi:hypothetical protein
MYQKDNNYKIQRTDYFEATSFNFSRNKLSIKSDIFPENYYLGDLMNPSGEEPNRLINNESKMNYLNIPKD